MNKDFEIGKVHSQLLYLVVYFSITDPEMREKHFRI
jgi:hypothetical protein